MGKLGELKCQKYLKKLNYKIIQNNYRTRRGEIDIIAWKNMEFAFIEVKTRNETLIFGEPIDAVDLKKQKRIHCIANSYLNRCHNIKWTSCRFDVMEVIISQQGDIKFINHIKNAF